MTTSSEPLCDEIPDEGSLLGLDYGRVRIGVAVSTPEQNLAVPLETWEPTGDLDDDAGGRGVRREVRVQGRRVCPQPSEYAAPQRFGEFPGGGVGHCLFGLRAG